MYCRLDPPKMYDNPPYGHASRKFPVIYRAFAFINYRKFTGNVWYACPYKVKGLLNGRGVSTWYTGKDLSTPPKHDINIYSKQLDHGEKLQYGWTWKVFTTIKPFKWLQKVFCHHLNTETDADHERFFTIYASGKCKHLKMKK